ncbi:MAG: hypothetical protein ACK4VI_06390 [Alphaproteobacteria bacterium]
MAIDNFGKFESDPQGQKNWDNLRKAAFVAAATDKIGEGGAIQALAEHNGIINSAVDALGIDDAFKAEVKKAMAATIGEISVEPS